MTLENLPAAGTDRFACPALDGRTGTLLRVGAGCAIVQWDAEGEAPREVTFSRLDKRTRQEVRRTVQFAPRRRPGPVSLALEVEPLPGRP